ncbi:MAG: hypothetical protein ABI210_13915, partial [Abditibacteriaceae bacterium]
MFACLCWLGMLAIFFGVVLEIREKRSGNSLGDMHFWVRIGSAVCWLLSLGLMSFAVLARWPHAGNEIEKHIFAGFLLAGLGFFLLALLVSLVDFVLFWRIRAARRRQLINEMDQWIQDKIEEQDNASSDDK